MKRTYEGLHKNQYDVDALADTSNPSNHVRVVKKDGKSFFVPVHDWLALAKIIEAERELKSAKVHLEEKHNADR